MVAGPCLRILSQCSYFQKAPLIARYRIHQSIMRVETSRNLFQIQVWSSLPLPMKNGVWQITNRSSSEMEEKNRGNEGNVSHDMMHQTWDRAMDDLPDPDLLDGDAGLQGRLRSLLKKLDIVSWRNFRAARQLWPTRVFNLCGNQSFTVQVFHWHMSA